MMAAAAGLALVVVAGLASAGIGLYRRAKHPATADGAPTATREAPPVAVSSPPAPAASAEPQEAPRPARIPPAVTLPAAPSAPPPALGERSHPSRPRQAAPAVESSPSLPDLKALFAAANEARRAGQRSQARELYTDLQRLYPDSREARLSFVSLGRMLLDTGETAESLQQFDRYLTAAPGDVLAAEAFYGRARALTALHRDSEAQRAWSDLLSRFPDSIYADVARRQLHKVASSPN
jgi:TolA-binding protein